MYINIHKCVKQFILFCLLQNEDFKIYVMVSCVCYYFMLSDVFIYYCVL